MPNSLKDFWTRLFPRPADDRAELDRLHALQRAATERRAEYAAEKDRVAPADDPEHAAALASSRQRMEAAERAHVDALQKWENRKSRQRSR